MSRILRKCDGGLRAGPRRDGRCASAPHQLPAPPLSPRLASPAYSPAEPGGGGFAWSGQHRVGYDGSRYWWGGDRWPTDPGGCDWAQ
jgi:hypothetical protein